MRYAVVIEKNGSGYSAYVPDLPGCVAAADSPGEVETAIGQAIHFHLEGLRSDDLPMPAAASRVEYVEVAA